MIRQSARKLAIVLGLVAVMVILPASPALANHWPLCSGSAGNFCVFKNTLGHDGGVKLFAGDDSNYSGNVFSRCYLNCDVNDATSSLRNRESYTVRSYVNGSYGGAYFNTSSGQARTSLPSGFNDALSSHRRV